MLTMSNEKRPKVTFDVPERIRRTLAVVAVEEDVSVGDIIERMTTSMFPEHLKRVDQAIAAGQAAPKLRRGRGRKPRPAP